MKIDVKFNSNNHSMNPEFSSSIPAGDGGTHVTIDGIVQDKLAIDEYVEEQLRDTKAEVDAIPKVLKNGLSENSLQQPEAFAGTKGYYWTNIDLEKKQIYLSETRSTPTLEAGAKDLTFKTPSYEAGNRICLVNGSKYNP